MERIICTDGTVFSLDIPLITENVLDSYKEVYAFIVRYYSRKFDISDEEARKHIVCVEEYAEQPNGKYEKLVHDESDSNDIVGCWYIYNILKAKKLAIFIYKKTT